MKIFYFTLTFLGFLHSVMSHGRLIHPPARTAMWRFGFKTASNYDDHAMSCGGLSGLGPNGECGVCGNRYNGKLTAEPGPDNQFASGTIGETYAEGSVIPITITVTVSHKGFHQFKLCVNDVPQTGKDRSVAVTQKCFDEHILESTNGLSKFPEEGIKDTTYNVQLPAGVTCKNCVLQWRWKTGNSWGCGPDGCGMGHGRQEEFWNCADVAIVKATGTSHSRPLPPPEPGVGGCTGKNAKDSTYDRYCRDTCSVGYNMACQYLCNCQGKSWSCKSSAPQYTGVYCYEKCTNFSFLKECPPACSCWMR